MGVKERHHLRAHLTDESMWGGGSDYGPGSVRSGRSGRKTSTNSAPRTLMTPVDFDVRSNASRVSRASKSSRGTSTRTWEGCERTRAEQGTSLWEEVEEARATAALPSLAGSPCHVWSRCPPCLPTS